MKTRRKDELFFKYERLPIFFYRCGILGHQDRECQKIKKGCLSSNKDELQFDLWLRTIAPKVSQKKGNVNQPNSSIDDDEEIQAPEGDGGLIDSSQVWHQQADVQLISKSGARTVCHQLTELKENPVEREFSNSLDPMLNSNSEQVSILSTPTLAENQVSLSTQTFIPDNSKLISLELQRLCGFLFG